MENSIRKNNPLKDNMSEFSCETDLRHHLDVKRGRSEIRVPVMKVVGFIHSIRFNQHPKPTSSVRDFSMSRPCVTSTHEPEELGHV